MALYKFANNKVYFHSSARYKHEKKGINDFHNVIYYVNWSVLWRFPPLRKIVFGTRKITIILHVKIRPISFRDVTRLLSCHF